MPTGIWIDSRGATARIPMGRARTATGKPGRARYQLPPQHTNRESTQPHTGDTPTNNSYPTRANPNRIRRNQ